MLAELSEVPNLLVCRLASWHLAYFYRTLNKRGAERGFVSRCTLPEGAEIFFNGYPE